MDRQTFCAVLAAAALCTTGMASGSMAADHREAPLIALDPAPTNGSSVDPAATDDAQTQEHDVIEEWRKRRYLQPRPPEVRPPAVKTPPPRPN